MRFLQTYAVVDHNLRILWVGGDWDEFAHGNQGPAAVANEVLSTRIDEHIVGRETKLAICNILSTVLDCQNELKIDYRCDSPAHLRRFQLTVKPMKDDRLLMVHDLRDVQQFAQPHGHWHYRHDAEARKCSFCNAVKLERGDWTAPEALTDHPSAVNYVICPTCEGHIDAAILAARSNRKTGRPLVNGFGPSE